MRTALLLALALLAGCAAPAPMGTPDPIDDPLPNLDRVQLPQDEEGRPMIVVENGVLRDLPNQISVLPPGSSTLLVRNVVEGAGVEVEGLDLSTQAIALWMRGRGSLRHLRPEHTIGPVNAGVQEDWNVDLPPGEYALTVTSGGTGDAIIFVGAGVR
ncbi:MAG: hypothetical protein GY898_20990 [Proteobacteria bacterium]|nr:hypothetical protein [Pseudomonadota bacterium]